MNTVLERKLLSSRVAATICIRFKPSTRTKPSTLSRSNMARELD
jgi:hypothetical protein